MNTPGSSEVEETEVYLGSRMVCMREKKSTWNGMEDCIESVESMKIE